MNTQKTSKPNSQKEEKDSQKSRSFLGLKRKVKADTEKVKENEEQEKGTEEETKEIEEQEKSSTENMEPSEEEKSGILSLSVIRPYLRKDIDDILFELEMSLLEGDVALEVAEEIINSVKEDLVGKKD